MCTYEHLVEATLPHGLIPLVVPQLRTITLGGAVTGLGIESTSFRNGLPHESVLEMDVLTGAGEVVTTRPGDDLFDAFPNSYGSLGYATRLRIELERVPAVRRAPPRPLRRLGRLPAAIAAIVETARVGRRAGRRARRRGVRARRGLPDPGPLDRRARADQRLHRPADLLPLAPAAGDRPADDATTTSGAGTPTGSGARGPSAPSTPSYAGIWPRRLRRSDVYHRLVALDRRLGIGDRLDRRAGRPQGERVVQDVEVPGRPAAGVPGWFDAEIGMRPVWLCPLRLRRTTPARPWPTYPLTAADDLRQRRLLGHRRRRARGADAPRNRAIEAKVHELGGHKSLYSEAFYDRDDVRRALRRRQPRRGQDSGTTRTTG